MGRPYQLAKNPNTTTRHNERQNSRPSKRAATNPFHCFLCRRELNRGGVLFNDQFGVLRVFVGPAGPRARGHLSYAGCARHANEVIDMALRPLAQQEGRFKLWIAACYRVLCEPGSGHAELGPALFFARARQIA